MAMSYKVIVSELAGYDIQEATEYYEIRQKGLGRFFILSLKDTFKLLARDPLIYIKVYGEIRRALTKKFPYAVFYRIDDENNEIAIYAIISSYRDPELWKKRIDEIDGNGTG